jgi:hypothetical protein
MAMLWYHWDSRKGQHRTVVPVVQDIMAAYLSRNESWHTIPFVLNDLHSFSSVLQYSYDVIVVTCCMNSTIRTPRKQLPTASWQSTSVLNFF